jgi:hypothetical protein
VDPSDQELYDQLLGYLAAEGTIEEEPESGSVLLTEHEHRELVQPLRLHLTPASFARHLRDGARDSAGAFPEVAPIEAAWRLFLVHLDEAVQTARDGETELVLRSYGVDSVRPDGARTPLAPEIEEYIALNEFYERLIQYYADRGELEIGIGNDDLTLYDLNGQSFAAPLCLRISSAELRRQMRSADDAEAAWQVLIDRIDALAFTVDPRASRLELTPGGIVVTDR